MSQQSQPGSSAQHGATLPPLYSDSMVHAAAQRRTLLSEAHAASDMAYDLAPQGVGGTHRMQQQWTRVDPPADQTALREMMAKAGAVHLVSPSGREYVAFKGTTTMADWKENLKQAVGSAFGKHSERYEMAAAIGRAFKDADPPVTFTGHSLGGGLAKLAAEAASRESTSKLAVGFNAASVAPATYRHQGLEPKIHERTTIHVVNENDLLNRVLKGGKLSVGGEALADRERLSDRPGESNSMIVVAKGGGSVKGSGHALKSFVPMNDNANHQHFDVPIAAGDGTAKELRDYNTYWPRIPSAQQAVATLERASSTLAIGQQRGPAETAQHGAGR